MGFFKWLLFPVTAPVYGTTWIAQQLQDEAERQYYDETAIRQEMLELERCYERGEMDEETFEHHSEMLLERLLGARARETEYDDV